jgi:hypothetical protein
MKVKSFFTDVGGADRVTKRREQLFKDSASPKEDFSDPINKVAKELHPDPLDVKVSKVEDVSPTARKYTFVRQWRFAAVPGGPICFPALQDRQTP